MKLSSKVLRLGKGIVIICYQMKARCLNTYTQIPMRSFLGRDAEHGISCCLRGYELCGYGGHQAVNQNRTLSTLAKVKNV